MIAIFVDIKFNHNDLTYIENNVLKLKGHPELKAVGGKAFTWFIDLKGSKEEGYSITAYDKSGYNNGTYKIINPKKNEIKKENISLFDGVMIRLKNGEVFDIEPVKN